MARSSAPLLLITTLMLLHMPVAMADCSAPSVDTKVIAQTVEQQLRSRMADQQLQLVMEPIGEWPSGELKEQRVLTQGLKSRVAVSLVLERCGQLVTSSAWFRVRAYHEAWVFSRNLRGESALDASMVSKERIDLAGAQLSLEELADQVEGFWLSRDVRAGMPVLKQHLQPEPLVKRHEAVKVVVAGQGLMLSTRGTAMRPGQLGDKIPVMLDWASSSLLAEVAGKGEVHVGQ